VVTIIPGSGLLSKNLEFVQLCALLANIKTRYFMQNFVF
jgi:hypothetical protein